MLTGGFFKTSEQAKERMDKSVHENLAILWLGEFYVVFEPQYQETKPCVEFELFIIIFLRKFNVP